MNETLPVILSCTKNDLDEAHLWLARVLTSFARAEQAIGQLCVEINLPTKSGPLGSVNELRNRLARAKNTHCNKLEKQIEKWQAYRPVRHVLAHATVRILYDEHHNPVIVTRHHPRDGNDVTPDRVWPTDESNDILRKVKNDGRSIADQIRNLLQDSAVMAELKKPGPGSSPG